MCFFSVDAPKIENNYFFSIKKDFIFQKLEDPAMQKVTEGDQQSP